ncbi:hypothetical protein [Demequina sp. NBRC 110052]|uniref:hypothetical protein n=1 Tax=Demequina sp. NBRC 110052 TaxID=1570341 RepID=UPI001180F937|nr:hypothetical protein [Demequina sp. NBRC 110052]
MDTATWVNIGLFLLTGVSVFVAARSLNSERRAQKDAGRLRAELVAANERVAQALERSRELAEGATPVHPIEFRQVARHEWRLYNQGRERMIEVTLSTPAAPGELMFPGGQPPISCLEPGDFIRVLHEPSLATPSHLQAEIAWRDTAGREHRVTRTL